MILIITNKLDPHADWVIRLLKRKGIDFARFNTEDFPQKVVVSWEASEVGFEGEVNLPSGKNVILSQVSACWYRRPLPPVVNKQIFTEHSKKFVLEESKEFLSFLWNNMNCFWINHPLDIKRAESKPLQLKFASKCGLSIPRTLITNSPKKAKEFCESCNGLVISKVLGRGEVEYQNDYYFIYTHRLKPEDLKNLSDIRFAPVIFQEHIEKSVEIRVTIFGEKVFACEIHSQDSEKTKDDWRHYDFENVKHEVHQLPIEIEKKCLKLVKLLGLKFGAIDMILTPGGQYVFLELNPNGQWLWVEHLVGLPISNALIDLLLNSLKSLRK